MLVWGNPVDGCELSPGGEVCAGHGGKEPLDGPALHAGADWVQVGEVVTAPEVLTDTGQWRRL